MDDFLNKIPKTILLIIVLTIGVLFIVIADPPKTVCDAQDELFTEEYKSFLLVDKERKLKTSKYQTLKNQCKIANSPGGCYELFNQMRKLKGNINKNTQRMSWRVDR